MTMLCVFPIVEGLLYLFGTQEVSFLLGQKKIVKGTIRCTYIISLLFSPMFPLEQIQIAQPVMMICRILLTASLVVLAVSAVEMHADDEVEPELRIRFVKGTDLSSSSPLDMLSEEVIPFVEELSQLFPFPVETLDEMTLVSQELPDLKCWYTVSLLENASTDHVATLLRGQQNIDVVEIATDAAPEPSWYKDDHALEEETQQRLLQESTNTPDFESQQEYLTAAPIGVDSLFARTVPGGKGDAVTVYDIEYDWNQQHEDLSKAANVERLVGEGNVVLASPFGNNNHGTAVLGIVSGDDNGFGVTGISPAANVGLVPQRFRNSFGRVVLNQGAAVLRAMQNGTPGDIILLEVQTSGVCAIGSCTSSDRTGCGPSEWIQSNFDAIQTATANGFIVVEAAGNSGVDLDGGNCNGLFDRNNRDSGAILVGAGQAVTRTRLSFSNFGRRLDVQGWGRSVATSGYGSSYKDPNDPDNINRWYRFTFSGTSSASAIVAGVAASIQGMAKDILDRPLSPKEMREVGCCVVS